MEDYNIVVVTVLGIYSEIDVAEEHTPLQCHSLFSILSLSTILNSFT